MYNRPFQLSGRLTWKPMSVGRKPSNRQWTGISPVAGTNRAEISLGPWGTLQAFLAENGVAAKPFGPVGARSKVSAAAGQWGIRAPASAKTAAKPIDGGRIIWAPLRAGRLLGCLVHASRPASIERRRRAL